MNRKKSLGKLKIACIVTLILGIALFGFVAPQVLGLFYSGITAAYIASLIYVECVGALCFVSLWQTWKICGEIGKDNSFSHENAKSLRKISKHMLAACVMMLAGMIASLMLRTLSLLTWLSALGVCISLIFSLFAAAMAELIEAGAKLKDENDLTI